MPERAMVALKIELKPDVIEFLDMSGIVLINGDIKSYVVNGHVYTETQEKGIYLITKLEVTKW